MIRKIGIALMKWLLPAICLGLLVLFRASRAGAAGLLFWLCLPLLSYILNLFARQHIQLELQAREAVTKRESVSVRVQIQNHSWLPVVRFLCELELQNQLTGECETCDIELVSVMQGAFERELAVQANHCGYLRAQVKHLYLTDWFGFLPMTVPLHSGVGVAVLPDLFYPEVQLDRAYAQTMDAETWSQTQRGRDLSEIYAIREYAEGDSLKQIHWKLSSKRGKLVVREASLPIEQSLLLFWDKNTAPATAEEMDAMAECAASISQSLLSGGYPFTLGWTNGDGNAYVEIDSEETLIQTVPRMLKYGSAFTAGSGLSIHDRMNEQSYAKTIYIAKQLPEDAQQPRADRMTTLLCDADTSCPWAEKTLRICAESYAEDFAVMDL